jgi:chromate transport protein ChrA
MDILLRLLDYALAIWGFGVVLVGLYGIFEKGADWSGYAPYPVVRALFWPLVIPIALLVLVGWLTSFVRRLFSPRQEKQRDE